MTERLNYFAYGSNMYSPRLRFRIDACDPLTLATLPGHQLRFHKAGADGSAKCDAHATGAPDDGVIGVVYEIAAEAKPRLDVYEGLGFGYRDATVDVVTADGKTISAVTYLASAEAVAPNLAPFTWYRDFVLAGAREHGLPEDYVEAFIEAVAAAPDPDADRERLRRAEILHAPL